MTPEHVQALMVRMRGIWPQPRSPESTAEWAAELSRWHPAVARAALNDLRDEAEFWPSIAAWTNACRRHGHLGIEARPAIGPAAEPDVAPPEVVAEHIAVIRGYLEAAKARDRAMFTPTRTRVAEVDDPVLRRIRTETRTLLAQQAEEAS